MSTTGIEENPQCYHRPRGADIMPIDASSGRMKGIWLLGEKTDHGGTKKMSND